MAWKAYIERVNDAPVSTDNVDMVVKFEDVEIGKTIMKNYSLTPGNSTTIADIEKVLQVDIDKLAEWHKLIDTLKTTYVGSKTEVVTAKAVAEVKP